MRFVCSLFVWIHRYVNPVVPARSFGAAWFDRPLYLTPPPPPKKSHPSIPTQTNRYAPGAGDLGGVGGGCCDEMAPVMGEATPIVGKGDANGGSGGNGNGNGTFKV